MIFSSLINIYQIIQIYRLINNIKNLNEITDEYCENIKQRIFAGGCIYIKFGQWLISKLKTDANTDPKIAKFCEYFEDIFEQCPYHHITHTQELFFSEYNVELNDFVSDLKLIASGSVGQVYQGILIKPVYLYKDTTFLSLDDLNNELEKDDMVDKNLDGIIKKVSKVAIKVKHPGINEDVEQKCYLFNLLAKAQEYPFLKNFFGLHMDFQEFINNIIQQIDFRNELTNCERFRENFAAERLIYFPKIFFATENIVISEFIECEEFDTIPEYKQMLTCYNFTCMVSKMMLIDNFAHLDLHHKNWKVRKYDDKDYQLIVFDYGIVYEANNIEVSRTIWDAFEIRSLEAINSILPDIIVGNITDDVRRDTEDIVRFYTTNTMNLPVMLNKLTNILEKHNCKLSAFTLNLALCLSLIDNILKKHNILNNVKPVTNHHLTVREKQLDIVAYCKSKKVYADYCEYVQKKLNRNANLFSHSRENIFVDTNNLDLDLPE